MKNLKDKSKNTKLISFAEPMESIDTNEVRSDVEMGIYKNFEQGVEIATEVNEFTALWNGLTDHSSVKAYQKLSGESHYSYKLSDEKVKAISEFPFVGFAKQIADTIVQKKAISEKIGR